MYSCYTSSLFQLTCVLMLTCQPSCPSDVECKTTVFCVGNVYNYAKFLTLNSYAKFCLKSISACFSRFILWFLA